MDISTNKNHLYKDNEDNGQKDCKNSCKIIIAFYIQSTPDNSIPR